MVTATFHAGDEDHSGHCKQGIGPCGQCPLICKSSCADGFMICQYRNKIFILIRLSVVGYDPSIGQ